MRLKFDHTNKTYVHKPESVLENETQRILWDFEIQTDCPIPVKSAGIVFINKEKKFSNAFCFSILGALKYTFMTRSGSI